MNGHLRDAREDVRLVKVSAHVCACGVRGEEPEAKGSHRFQPQNLGRAVRDAVGEMCPNPAPATPKGPGDGAFPFSSRERSAGFCPPSNGTPVAPELFKC